MLKTIAKPVVATLMLAGATALPAPAAGAELPPQVLGLIATASPVPLNCADGVCSALLSSFCLQEDRPVPADGQRYEVAGMGDVTVVVTRSDGRLAEFSATGLIDYVSEGDFTRIRAEMDEARLASLDATAVSVHVQPLVSLLPRVERGVSSEVTARDAEVASGAPRMLAEGFFKMGTVRSDSAQTLRRMISALPAAGSEIGGATPALREDVWSKVRAGEALRGLSEAGVTRAKGALDRCGAFADMGVALTLRGCLENSHDQTLRAINEEYWKSDPAGY